MSEQEAKAIKELRAMAKLYFARGHALKAKELLDLADKIASRVEQSDNLIVFAPSPKTNRKA
jgi:predicted RecB family endonuclease